MRGWLIAKSSLSIMRAFALGNNEPRFREIISPRKVSNSAHWASPPFSSVSNSSAFSSIRLGSSRFLADQHSWRQVQLLPSRHVLGLLGIFSAFAATGCIRSITVHATMPLWASPPRVGHPPHARRLGTRRSATKPDADLFCGYARSCVRGTSSSVVLSAKVQGVRQRIDLSPSLKMLIDTHSLRALRFGR